MGRQGFEDRADDRREKEDTVGKKDILNKDDMNEKDDRLSEKARGEAAIMMLMLEESKRRKKTDIRIKRMKMITRIIVALGIIAILCAVPLAKKAVLHKGYGGPHADTKSDTEKAVNVDAAIEAEAVGSAYSTARAATVYTVRLTKVEQGSSEKALIVGKEITIYVDGETDIKDGDILNGKITSFDSESDIWTFVSEDQ